MDLYQKQCNTKKRTLEVWTPIDEKINYNYYLAVFILNNGDHFADDHITLDLKEIKPTTKIFKSNGNNSEISFNEIKRSLINSIEYTIDRF